MRPIPFKMPFLLLATRFVLLMPNLSAIEIWVKPSNLEYTAKIMCHGFMEKEEELIIDDSRHVYDHLEDKLIVVGNAAKGKSVGAQIVGPVSIEPDLGKCKEELIFPKIYIEIETEHKSRKYEMQNLALRQSPIVFSGFYMAIVPSNKIFHMDVKTIFFGMIKNVSLPLACELALSCSLFVGGSTYQFLMFGSAVQKNCQKNSMVIPIYEEKLLSRCQAGRIEVQLFYDRKKMSFVMLTRDLIDSHEFIINSESQRVETFVHFAPFAGQWSKWDKNNSIPTCFDCKENDGQIALIPCGHFSFCFACAVKFNAFKPCPICGQKVDKRLMIQNGDNITTQCSFCSQNERKYAFMPCGHFAACEECAKELIKEGEICPFCKKKIGGILKLYFATRN